jgi:predicted ATPase
MAKLNRLAAEKARKRSAFLPAAVYEDAAISLLGEKVWGDDPCAAAMELYEAAATCYLACGRSGRSLEIADGMLEHTTSTRDILRAQSIQLEAIEHQRRFDEGKELGMTMLRSLGSTTESCRAHRAGDGRSTVFKGTQRRWQRVWRLYRDHHEVASLYIPWCWP